MKGSRAFTLIEILVALGIMAVGITSVLMIFTAAANLHKRAVDQMNAAFIAQTVISEIDGFLAASNWADLDNAFSGTVSGFPRYTYKARTVPLDVWNNEYFVECEVAGKEKGIKQIEKFRTILVRRLTYRDKDLDAPMPGTGGGF